jgi:hypothetical protein
MYKAVAELEKIAGQVVEEYGDATLEQLLAPSSVTGVAGELKNLIFAANGPKPQSTCAVRR